jgi:NAD-dependent SIR2 family protein deacetylase
MDNEGETSGRGHSPTLMTLSITQPDITFFGEKLGDKFENALFKDREDVDLLLVIGTSLKVAPVSDILCMRFSFDVLAASDKFDPAHLPHSVPQVWLITLSVSSSNHYIDPDQQNSREAYQPRCKYI